MKWMISATCTVPLMENPTPLSTRKRIMVAILPLLRAKPKRPMLMSTLLTISSMMLLRLSAMTPQKGRQTRLVMENSPTTKPAKVMPTPRLTRYLDMMVATM